MLFEQSGIHTEVEIEVQGDHLIIRTASRVRNGWDASFAVMAEQHDDSLLDGANSTDWDQAEWDWSSSVSMSSWLILTPLLAAKFRRHDPALLFRQMR